MLVEVNDELVFFNSKDDVEGVSVVSITNDFNIVVHDGNIVPENEFSLELGLVRNENIPVEIMDDPDRQYVYTTLDGVNVSDDEEEDD